MRNGSLGEHMTIDVEETAEQFADRVFDATGIALNAIPDGVPEDMLAGQILCRRGPTAIVSYGYPIETSDGPVYREFRVIDRTPDLPAFLQGTALIRLWGISGDLRSELTGTHSEARERAYELGGSGPSVTWGGRLVLRGGVDLRGSGSPLRTTMITNTCHQERSALATNTRDEYRFARCDALTLEDERSVFAETGVAVTRTCSRRETAPQWCRV